MAKLKSIMANIIKLCQTMVNMAKYGSYGKYIAVIAKYIRLKKLWQFRQFYT